RVPVRGTGVRPVVRRRLQPDRRRPRDRGLPPTRRRGPRSEDADVDLGGPPGGREEGKCALMRVHLTVNGRPREADDVWEGESLLYVLRERLGLPGSKNACEQGECGSCTVRLDDVLVCSCLVAAGQAEGRSVVTVEGLADHAKRRA